MWYEKSPNLQVDGIGSLQCDIRNLRLSLVHHCSQVALLFSAHSLMKSLHWLGFVWKINTYGSVLNLIELTDAVKSHDLFPLWSIRCRLGGRWEEMWRVSYWSTITLRVLGYQIKSKIWSKKHQCNHVKKTITFKIKFFQIWYNGLQNSVYESSEHAENNH